ncbi:MAG: amidase [Pseudomonadota bacterium]
MRPSDTDLLDLSALALSDGLAARHFSAEEVMQATLARIAAVNPRLNAVVSLRDEEQLLQEARAADAAARRGWLHGVPIAIKDLAHVQGLVTSMGSPLFADFVAPQDDLMVARLRAAGALIIGKTNTPEFGLGSHTYNPVHGATANAYDVTRSAGGSSGGAAVALAARILSVADGSDMMGSLRNPAAWSNVYGMRPSWGTVIGGTEGELFAQQLSTSGPMARSPSDLAALLDTMTGADPRQPLSRTVSPWLPMLAEPLSRLNLGWTGAWGLPIEPGLLTLGDAARAQFADLGHAHRELPDPFDMHALWESWTTLRAFVVSASALAHYDTPAERALLKPAALWEVEKGLSLTPRDLHRANAIRSDWYRRSLALFEEVDVLVMPSTQCWPFALELDHPKEIAGVQMDTYHRWMQIVIPASLIGLPVVNVPIGFGENGLPAGLQLIGARGTDGLLLQLAQEWHRATSWPDKRPPDLQ